MGERLGSILAPGRTSEDVDSPGAGGISGWKITKRSIRALVRLTRTLAEGMRTDTKGRGCH